MKNKSPIALFLKILYCFGVREYDNKEAYLGKGRTSSMDEFFDQFFPTDFLIEYLENGPRENTDRFETYVVYRFLSFAAKEYPAVVKTLRDSLECPLSTQNFFDITKYLDEDFYFSPSFAENSFDPVLLCYAIAIIDDCSGFGVAVLNRVIKDICPEIASVDFSDTDLALDLLLDTQVQFYAALTVCSIHYSTLTALLPKFAEAYMEDFHFTCEDFVLYDFMDEYFETKNCTVQPVFNEMIDTLVLATLQSFDTDLENFTLDGLFQLKHPSGRFSSVYRIGAMDMRDLPSPEEAAKLMKHILSYAAAYELRNNLYDYHLDEDKTITLGNWKTNLKWHYVQYTNVYSLALSSFVSACYSRKLLKKQFEENLLDLEDL